MVELQNVYDDALALDIVRHVSEALVQEFVTKHSFCNGLPFSRVHAPITASSLHVTFSYKCRPQLRK